jgi:transposase InsO family protein
MSTKPRTGRVRSTYEFIKAHRGRYSVQTMCRVLGVAPSGYYEWLQQPISNHGQEDARLLRLIRASFVASHGIYGAPRVFLDLREAGETCSKHRRRSRQAADPPRRGSGARVYADASGPSVSGCVRESVSRLAPTRGGVCARRSVVLSRTSPHRLTLAEVQAIGDMVTAPEYRHVPTGTLAILAQRLGTVSASPATWYRLVQKYGWRRPRLRMHPAKPKVGLRTTEPDEMWHIDTTIVRLLDGTRAYVHAVIDNFSRRILAWRVTDTFAAVNSVAVLLEAIQGARRSASAPVVLADAGVENVNAQVDALIDTGVLRRLLAFTELKFSNSMIEAWWRSLKHQWLCLHSLNRVATIRRPVAFYVHEHNHVLPHSTFRGQTPDEMYFGNGEAVATDLTARALAARRARVAANRSASCTACSSLDALA